MENAKIKVLYIIPSLNLGGMETFAVNLFKAIDKNRFEIHFLLNTYGSKDYYLDEVIKLGGIVHKTDKDMISNKFRRIKKFQKDIIKIIETEKIDVVHIHTCYSLLYIAAKAAKKAGCKTIIMHSHSTSANQERFLAKVFKHRARKYATNYFACGLEAGNWLFGKKFLFYKQSKIIPNGFDVKSFKFSREQQVAQRAKYGISESDFVIGMVSRLAHVKNHIFMLNVFDAIKDKKHLKLVIVGDGPEKENIQTFINGHNLASHVKLLGLKSDVSSILNMFDLYVLPSLYEGIPTSALEAQANGLPCIISDRVDAHSKLLDDTYFLPIDFGTDEWVKQIDIIRQSPKGINIRQENNQEIIDKGYDMADVAKQIEDVYSAKK